MAANQSGIRDEDGTYSDWIELLNAGTISANLDGWFLTDETTNLTKWRFPAVTMLPNSYLLVFASGKNRTNNLNALHTNFQLNKDGEFLALVDPQTNVVSQFYPKYPAQFTDVSYGRDLGDLNVLGYFITPTPRAPNSTKGP